MQTRDVYADRPSNANPPADWTPDASQTLWRFSREIAKPLLDDRDYRLVTLQNDLQVLLVSDPSADQAGMALDVGIGHMADPEDMPGLAHFCEHLSFLGTKLYPQENAYKQYIKLHGGATNASTSASTTTYHFSVQAPHFVGAVERFSAFFHSPLFDPSCVGREVMAVDSENSKNQQSDSRRMHQLWKSLVDPVHPWNKFGCGHKGTLLAHADPSPDGASHDDDDTFARTRKRVIDWWMDHYSAERMKAVIVGSESLEALEAMAVRHLLAVPNRALGPLPITTLPLWPEADFPPITFVKAIRDMHRIELRFPISYQDPLYKSHPTRYIVHLLGHEGPGSAFHLLKQSGLATALSCYLSSAGRGTSLLDVDISLTKLGLAHYRRVLAILFHYISLLPAALGTPYHYEERRRIAEIGFLYAEKSGSPGTHAKMLAQRLNASYATEDVLSCGANKWVFDENHIRDVLKCLTANQARLLVASQNFAELEEASGNWEKEKWYQTEYHISKATIRDLPTLSQDEIAQLHLPDVNPFIPNRLDVDRVKIDNPLLAPSLVHQTPKGHLWFKKDDQFWRPRGSVTVKLQSPIIGNTLAQVIRTKVMMDLLSDSLKPRGYSTNLAGIVYSISCSPYDVVVRVSGYNDRLQDVLSMVLTEMTHLVIKQDRFDVIIEKMKRMYDNTYKTQSSEVSDMFLRNALDEKSFRSPDRRNELDHTSLDDVAAHSKQIFAQTISTILVHGNLTLEQAREIQNLVEVAFASRSVPISEQFAPRSLLLPSVCNFVLSLPVPNEKEANSSISYVCMVGPATDGHTRAALSLLNTMLSEPFFSTIRTKEQLGYSVSNAVWNHWSSSGDIGLRFRIQSTRHPRFLEERIDAFLDGYLGTLKEMSEADFALHKRGVVDRKRTKLVNLGEEYTRFWIHIDTGDLDFEQAEQDAQIIETLELSAIVTFFESRVHPGSPNRRKLSVQLLSQTTEDTYSSTGENVIPGITPREFKSIDAVRAELRVSAATMAKRPPLEIRAADMEGD